MEDASGLGLCSPEVLDALAAIDDAIRWGYDVTRRDLKAKGFDPRVSKTAFGQELHHNVSQRVYNIGGNLPDIVTDLPPNMRRSHHHVIVVAGRVLFTVSAVKRRDQAPRYAVHRNRYAFLQEYFRIGDDGAFEIVPVPDPYDPGSLYVQVVHGPAPGDPQQHGFTVLRALDVDNNYYPLVINLEEFLASTMTTSSGTANVTEDFEITVISPTGASQHENR